MDWEGVGFDSLACVVDGDRVGGGGDDNPWLLGEAPSAADKPFIEDDVVPRSADGAEAGKGD